MSLVEMRNKNSREEHMKLYLKLMWMSLGKGACLFVVSLLAAFWHGRMSDAVWWNDCGCGFLLGILLVPAFYYMVMNLMAAGCMAMAVDHCRKEGNGLDESQPDA